MTSTAQVVAVPDLHGRLDLLDGALALFPQAHVVVLGDVIDRGPQALACIRRLLDLHAEGRATLLMGNHERMARDSQLAWQRFADSRDPADERRALLAFRRWMEVGGETLRREAGGFAPGRWPPELTRYLDLLWPLAYATGDGRVSADLPTGPSVLLSHASPPKFTRDFADPFEAALWLRPTDGPFELPPGVAYSVHGHTPVRAPLRVGAQLYLDLGAYQTGRLALLPLEPAGPGEVSVLAGAGRSTRPLPQFGTPLRARTLDLRAPPGRAAGAG